MRGRSSRVNGRGKILKTDFTTIALHFVSRLNDPQTRNRQKGESDKKGVDFRAILIGRCAPELFWRATGVEVWREGVFGFWV